MSTTKEIKGYVEINYGADNFCYVHARNGRRVNLTEWMKKFDGKKVLVRVFTKEKKKPMSQEKSR